MSTAIVRASVLSDGGVPRESDVGHPQPAVGETVPTVVAPAESGPAPGTERSGADLIRASSAYQTESRGLTWFLFLTTLAALALAAWAVIAVPWWPIKALAAVILGLIQVRLFIFFHDALHGAIFAGSRVGHLLMSIIGFYVVAVRSVWKETHDYHHQNNAKLVGSSIGSFPVLTVGMRERITPAQHRAYRVARHPLTIFLGYFTVFLFGMTIPPFRRDPKRHWAAPLAAILHVAVFLAVAWAVGWVDALFLIGVAGFVASCVGSYLFYAQHNFPAMRLRGRRDWNHAFAALNSSSMFDMSPLMHWFTGNIGYHHVHHLNHRIPFYRLPEAMRGMPELHRPGRTSWRLRDIRACLALYLWDPEADRMLTYAEARARGL
jgi:omega-6 fatty acid desaturase (delta-12 desaturase)